MTGPRFGQSAGQSEAAQEEEPAKKVWCESFAQTRARLYREHKARGTLGVFYSLYPRG